MTKTDISPPATPTPGSVLRRIALPMFLFSALLFSFLFLSWFLLLPRMTLVEVAGQERNTLELRQHTATLQASIASIESQRDDLVTPLREGLYGELREAKYDMPAFSMLRGELAATIADVVGKKKDAIVIHALHFDPIEKTFSVRGDVRNVGSQSMTLLARLVEAVKGWTFVKERELPRFVREIDPDIGPHSPFRFVLHLR